MLLDKSNSIPVIIMTAINEVIEKKGLCIYGTRELLNAPDEVKNAFRLGSALAFDETANILETAINKLNEHYVSNK